MRQYGYHHRTVVVICGIVILAGCVPQNDPRLRKVAELEASVTALQGQLTAAEERLSSVEADVSVLQASGDPYKAAAFDPGTPGPYQRLDTTSGTFLVSVQNVTPYLDGFRVTCDFGNPSSATFNGFKLKAKWGPRLDLKNKKMTLRQWTEALREKDISLTASLRPASWNRLSFVVSPASAEEFGYLELSMETNSVSLQAAR